MLFALSVPRCFSSSCFRYLFLAETDTGGQKLGCIEGRVLFATWYSLYVQLSSLILFPALHGLCASRLSASYVGFFFLLFLFFFLVHSERKVDCDGPGQGGPSLYFLTICCGPKGRRLVQEKGRDGTAGQISCADTGEGAGAGADTAGSCRLDKVQARKRQDDVIESS